MKAFWMIPAVLALLLAGCVKKPENITPVDKFDASRYLGKWYEIARLDHSFERGLNNVTAQYSMGDDGGIKVLNRGYDTATAFNERLMGSMRRASDVQRYLQEDEE